MGTKHTPGPWELYPPTQGRADMIIATRNNYDFHHIARLFCESAGLPGMSSRGPSLGEAEANAALIAAAPDLLAACKELVKELEDDNENLSLSAGYARADLIIHALTVIAKAEAQQ